MERSGRVINIQSTPDRANNFLPSRTSDFACTFGVLRASGDTEEYARYVAIGPLDGACWIARNAASRARENRKAVASVVQLVLESR